MFQTSQVGIIGVNIYNLYLSFFVDHFKLEKFVTRLFLLWFCLENLPGIALTYFLGYIMHTDLGSLGLAIKSMD